MRFSTVVKIATLLNVYLYCSVSITNQVGSPFLNTIHSSEHYVILECSAHGTGSIVFYGSALNCSASNNELTFVLKEGITVNKSCNDGLIFANATLKNGTSTSYLNITLTSDLIGRNISCSYDDGVIARHIGVYTIRPNSTHPITIETDLNVTAAPTSATRNMTGK